MHHLECCPVGTLAVCVLCVLGLLFVLGGVGEAIAPPTPYVPRVVLIAAGTFYVALGLSLLLTGILELIDRRGNHAVSLHNLGLIALRRGNPEQAADLCSRSTQMFGDLLDSIGVTISLDALAAVSGERGEVRKAVRVWGAAQTLRDAMGVSQPPDDKEVLEPFVEAARSSLEAAAFQAAWEEGRAMTQEQAVALALQDVGNGEHTARAEPA